MVTVTTEIIIAAPIQHCFDMARNIDVHTETVWKHTQERAIAGVTSGCIAAGDNVTFEAVHFGVRQQLVSRVVEYDAPYLFVDEMQRGAFKSLKHTHQFENFESGTLMRDILQFEAPFGVLGWITEKLILKAYMRRFLEHRNNELKKLVELKYGDTSS